jgi:hypothetical protein
MSSTPFASRGEMAITTCSESRWQCFRTVLHRFAWRESNPSKNEDKLASRWLSPWDDETSVHMTCFWYVLFSEEGDAELNAVLCFFCRVFHSVASGRVHVIQLLVHLIFLCQWLNVWVCLEVDLNRGSTLLYILKSNQLERERASSAHNAGKWQLHLLRHGDFR